MDPAVHGFFLSLPRVLGYPAPLPNPHPLLLLPPAPVCAQRNSTAGSDPDRGPGCRLWLAAAAQAVAGPATSMPFRQVVQTEVVSGCRPHDLSPPLIMSLEGKAVVIKGVLPTDLPCSALHCPALLPLGSQVKGVGSWAGKVGAIYSLLIGGDRQGHSARGCESPALQATGERPPGATSPASPAPPPPCWALALRAL